MSFNEAKPREGSCATFQRKKMKYTIATGNPKDGFSLLGIFQSMEEALLYGEATKIPNDWVVMEIFTADQEAKNV
jgi:hypothetical protein